MERNIDNGGQAAAHHHQACAACKHQRKKCTSDCVLAPFFTAAKINEFQAVHRLFGVSNVQKLVRNVSSNEERHLVVQSLIWEASWRQEDPVLGPFGEYRRVLEELNLFKRSQVLRINPIQENVIYKQPAGLYGWPGNNGVGAGVGIHNSNNSNNVNYINNNRNMLLDPSTYSFPSHDQEGLGLDGREEALDTGVCPQVLNQDYYLSADRLDRVDGVNLKEEDTMWDGGS